jgi:hypothetical protein
MIRLDWGRVGMERREPGPGRGDPPPGVDADWGNVRFRSRRAGAAAGTPDDNADARFWIGLIVFVFVALAYPWYSYRVQAYLQARDLQAAGEELGRQLEASTSQMRQQMEASNARMRQRSAAEAARRQAAADHARIAAVRVVGTFPAKAGPVAIVNLGQAGLPEATAIICRQAEGMLDLPLAGQVLHVRRYRGDQPAMGVGDIRC